MVINELYFCHVLKSNLQNLNHDILNKLSDIQKAYFGQAGNDFDKLDHMQQYLVANVYVFQGPVLPPWDKVYSFGSRDYIESYIWKKNPAHLSIFSDEYWVRKFETHPLRFFNPGLASHQVNIEKVKQQNEALAEALNEVSTEDILADGSIAGLGSRNEDFIKAKPELHNEVNKYFKVNDFSKASSDCVNYLLNQYHNGGDFAANTNLYKSANTPLYQNAQNPNRALEWKPGTQAVAEGFTNFGNVLSSLFENYPNPAYEGRIIRDMFKLNGINVPSNVINKALGRQFEFIKTSNPVSVEIGYEGTFGNFLWSVGINTPVLLGDTFIQSYINDNYSIKEVMALIANKKALKKLSKSPSYKIEVVNLLNKSLPLVTNKKEFLYLGTENNSGVIQFNLAAESNENEAEANAVFNSPVSSIMHNHFAGTVNQLQSGGTIKKTPLLRTFSPVDIANLWTLNDKNKFKNVSEFSLIVTTPDQSIHAITISNKDLFQTQMKKYGSKKLFELFLSLKFTDQNNLIVPNIGSEVVVKRLAKMLRPYGMSIFTSNKNDLEKWIKVRTF